MGLGGQPVPKSTPQALVKRRIDGALRRQFQELRARVAKRDGNRCRLCGKQGYEAHHIEFKSRGGKDAMANLVLLCAQCHRDVHGHIVKLAGIAQGRKQLRVGRWDDDANDWLWERM